MANLPENSIWEAGIYQIEETDVVRGGPVSSGGISNKQSQQLGNRTKYLYDHLGKIGDVITKNVNGNISIGSNDLLRNHVIFNLSANTKTATLDISALPDSAIISISTSGTNSYCIKLAGSNNETFVNSRFFADDHIWLYVGENITLMKSGSTLIVLNTNAQTDEVGEILYKAMPPMFALEAKGQLISRSEYPRLWETVNAHSECFVSDYNWLYYDDNYKGAFSSGNGSTNFRLPDLRAMFIRGKDNGRGVDLDRIYSGEGGYQKDEIKKHSHSIHFDEYPDGKTQNPGYDGGNNHYKTDFDKDTSLEGGTETRPKNIAYTAYIKY